MRLNQAQLAALAHRSAAPTHEHALTLPSYDRSRLQPGIVHLGLGAFHRAHQALYTETAIAAGDLRWGIIGVSLRSTDTRDALAPQDHLYTVAIRDAQGERLQVAGALLASLVAPESPQAVLDAMADARCHIVSLTVTEKGYCYDPASRALLLDHPDIVHDLRSAEPRSAIGFIVHALARRRHAGLPPFTVVSCDNLPANGDTTRGMVLAFATALDPALAQWIAAEVAFPNSMVDRIVPKTSADDLAHVTGCLGMEDAWPVMTEGFSQWVLEDRFCGPRPRWEEAGVTVVGQAAPYEHAKLRMLNGSHSTLAYLGALIGYETVDRAMEDPQLEHFVTTMLAEEVEPTLERPGLPTYRAELMQRFRNPALKHRLQQIAMDGSQKIPQRLLGTLRQRRAAGLSHTRLCFALAGWFRYLAGQDEAGRDYSLSDPLAQPLQAAATVAGGSAARVAALLRMTAVFGDDLSGDAALQATLTQHLELIRTQGVKNAMHTLDLA
ncbi:mannitol dehydrogenase family protein [Herbaspirillum sp. NPDC087042]|uniref:mannitol dehydrogenase family protein n=1 Tax=Herbaspirillum sp. NPDC087042 TaxID=3364004 RepID=UPI00382EF781